MNHTATYTNDQVRKLLPHHLAELRASGLSDATIAAAGIHSETNTTRLAVILGWRKVPAKMAPAIVFPFPDADGRPAYYRIKPDIPRVNSRDGKKIKYESPKGRPNEIYVMPEVAALFDDPSRELILTEGEKKSLKSTQEGFPCIGLVGVFGWKQKGESRLLPCLERVKWSGRRVYIIFDSDAAVKEEVRDAEARLAKLLTDRGAVVKIVRLPGGPVGADGQPTKVGLDDFLVTHHIGDLRRLLDAADDPEPVEPVVMKENADRMDPATEAESQLSAVLHDGVHKLCYWRGSWYSWQRGRYAEFTDQDIRGRVIRALNERYSMLSRSHVGDVLDQLKAQSALSSRLDAPAWRDEHGVDWDASEVLVTRNAIVHLPSLIAGQSPYAIPATPKLFSLTALDYDFALDAPEPVEWLAFLRKLWRDDDESIAAIQEWLGYLLTPDTSQQKILMLIGPKRAGKGVIARVARGMIGPENVAGPTLAGLATNFGLWPLLGKSLAIVNDARLGGRTDQGIVVERLLSISGEDALTVDRKNLQPVTTKIPARLMIVSNELPRVSDSSGALAGRMILLRLTESWYGREDRALTDRLLAERSGILLWAIEGWRRLRERGYFAQPASGGELLGELADIASPVAMFLRERCHIGPEFTVSRKALYEAYVEWARSKGRDHVEDEIGFGRNLRAAVTIRDAHPRTEGGHRERCYIGVGLQ